VLRRYFFIPLPRPLPLRGRGEKLLLLLGERGKYVRIGI
jgi:hypothetical protein|tara:strand:+ start:733 stop:849 length:117 start_codon:yes stop_codon:yes gene_type:complete